MATTAGIRPPVILALAVLLIGAGLPAWSEEPAATTAAEVAPAAEDPLTPITSVLGKDGKPNRAVYVSEATTYTRPVDLAAVRAGLRLVPQEGQAGGEIPDRVAAAGTLGAHKNPDRLRIAVPDRQLDQRGRRLPRAASPRRCTCPPPRTTMASTASTSAATPTAAIGRSRTTGRRAARTPGAGDAGQGLQCHGRRFPRPAAGAGARLWAVGPTAR